MFCKTIPENTHLFNDTATMLQYVNICLYNLRRINFHYNKNKTKTFVTVLENIFLLQNAVESELIETSTDHNLLMKVETL